MNDCSVARIVKFIFEYIMSRFGCPKILMSDRGSHFFNEMIVALIEEFQMYHQKSTSHHRQVNGTVEAFNKIMENSLTKISIEKWNDWDVRIPAILCSYRNTYKILTG